MIKDRYEPNPIAYKDYQASEARAETDKNFVKMDKLYAQVSMYGPKYREVIETAMKEKVSAKILFDLVLEENYQKLCGAEGDLNCFIFISLIACKEESLGLSTLLNDINSLEEAISFYQQIIFGLRRIAFGFDEVEMEDYLYFIKERNISFVCLAEVIHYITGINQMDTACKLALLLKKCDMKSKAINMLCLLSTIFPYSEEKILAFTSAFLELGSVKMAYEELQRYQNPSSSISRMIQQLAAKL